MTFTERQGRTLEFENLHFLFCHSAFNMPRFLKSEPLSGGRGAAQSGEKGIGDFYNYTYVISKPGIQALCKTSNDAFFWNMRKIAKLNDPSVLQGY